MVSDTPLIDYFFVHWKLAVVLFIVCEGFGLCLIARLWVARRKLSVRVVGGAPGSRSRLVVFRSVLSSAGAR